MRRRQFIAGFAYAAVWALGARAQQPNRMRTLAVLAGGTESDLNSRGWLAAFDAALHSFGWVDGQNIRIDRRYTPSSLSD
jgi:putative tryptophan/tyrosine transport system substrate-binding protein